MSIYYVSTRTRNATLHGERSAFAPRTMWLLGCPEIGQTMAFVGTTGQSLVTSRIERILQRTSDSSLYVQTHNSLYELREASLFDDEDDPGRLAGGAIEDRQLEDHVFVELLVGDE